MFYLSQCKSLCPCEICLNKVKECIAVFVVSFFYGLLSILKASKYIYIYTRLVEALHKQLFMYEIFFASFFFMISYFL